MSQKNRLLFFLLTCCLLFGCENQSTKNNESPNMDFAVEKQAILSTLNSETKAAFQRNYEDWSDKWVHSSAVTKIYLNFADNSFSESIGWEKVSGFVKDYFIKHPEPEPVPELLDDIQVQLYENGAWVVFEQDDALRGRKRETRLMEKVNGQWKIAGMTTTIYKAEK